MIIKELYRHFLVQLQSIYSPNEATVVADWVFESIAGITRMQVLKYPDQQPDPSVVSLLQVKLLQLLQHKPVQYVLGEAWFYSIKLKVNENVLIPRPETEELVAHALSEWHGKLTDPAILDIGTGSGCIPIALKKHLPAAVITAIDISEAALKVAKENAARYKAAINFVQMNFLDELQWKEFQQFDVIISNPPYIPLSEKEKLDKNVADYEPAIALFVPENDPLLFYKKIAALGKTHLKPNGRIYLETHEDHAKATAAHFEKSYSFVEIKKDIFGKERMLIAGDRR